MVSRTIAVWTCDHCAHEQREVEAVETVFVRFGSDVPRAVDVCKEHARQWHRMQVIARTRGERSASGVRVPRRTGDAEKVH